MSSLSLDSSPLDDTISADEQKNTKLQHFTHEHMLTYTRNDTARKCFLCQYMIYDDYEYSCKTCKFFLHESCSQVPRYIPTSMHPMHPLQLFSFVKQVPKPACSLCEEKLHYLGYKCSACDFNLHTDCATETTFDPKDHQHAFRNSRPTLFTCDACGIDEHTKRFACVCSICQLHVHKKCSPMFPLTATVRQRMHPHELTLRYAFEIGFDFSEKFCKICSQKMNDVFCLYQCKDIACASYIAHAKCATSPNLLMNIDIDHGEAAHNTSDQLVEYKKVQEEVIKHFSHPHTLYLSSVEPEDDVTTCYGCVRPITVPFYACADDEQCKFFLHKQCYDLPKTIQSPIHRHPLKLKDFLDLDVRNIVHGFTCQACQAQCNGFVYLCEVCDHETFDVGCTLFGDTLKHESHKCTLTLVSTIANDENTCIACGSTFSTAFWCEECNYFLDLKCASLPRTIGHDCPTGTVWSIKPLTLWYDCIEHAGGQYYCDLCGETRGKDLWFYHCEDCHDSIHPQCLLGDDRFMYGKSYNIDGHCHTVCVAKKPKLDPLCDTCGKPCKNSPLVFCPTCKVYMHDDLGCCGVLTSSRFELIRHYSCGVSSSQRANEDGDGNDGNKNLIVYRAHSHFHNLTTVMIDEGNRFGGCAVCQKILEVGPAFYCAECEANFHVKCCRGVQRA